MLPQVKKRVFRLPFLDIVKTFVVIRDYIKKRKHLHSTTCIREESRNKSERFGKVSNKLTFYLTWENGGRGCLFSLKLLPNAFDEGVKLARMFCRASNGPLSTLRRLDRFASSIYPPTQDSSASFEVALPQTRCNQDIARFYL